MTTEQVTLSAAARSDTGKGAARRLRREGLIPAVVYGHGEESTHLSLNADEVEHLLGRISAGTTVIGLEVGNKKARNVLIREVQRHPFRPIILHIDFFQIREDEKIRVAIPVHLEGMAEGVEAGGILQQIRHEIQVECLPGDIPEGFHIDVTALVVGDSLHIGDLDSGGVAVLEDPDLTVCTVVPPTVMKVEEEEEVEEEELEAVEAEAEEEGEPAVEARAEDESGASKG
jgi:large subunit ribosomal protein L25